MHLRGKPLHTSALGFQFGDLDPSSAEFFLQEERLAHMKAAYERQCRVSGSGRADFCPRQQGRFSAARAVASVGWLACSVVDCCLPVVVQELQDQIDELQSQLQEFRAQGRVVQPSFKNSLFEELDDGGVECNQGKCLSHLADVLLEPRMSQEVLLGWRELLPTYLAWAQVIV